MNNLGWCLVAQGDAQGGNPFSFGPAILLICVVYFFMFILGPQRKRDKEHKALLENLKKNDRVVTIGGIYGVVVNVQRDQDEVVLKVDESANAKLRVTLNAIARVITETNSDDKTAKT